MFNIASGVARGIDILEKIRSPAKSSRFSGSVGWENLAELKFSRGALFSATEP